MLATQVAGCRDDDIYDEDVDQPQSSRRNLSPLPQNTAANQNEIILHALSPKMAHGKIINWLKVEGEEVRRHDIVAIISGNDCGMKYISSPMDGIVAVLKAQEGETIQVGSVLALVGGDDYEVKRMQSKAKNQQRMEFRDRLRKDNNSIDDSDNVSRLDELRDRLKVIVDSFDVSANDSQSDDDTDDDDDVGKKKKIEKENQGDGDVLTSGYSILG